LINWLETLLRWSARPDALKFSPGHCITEMQENVLVQHKTQWNQTHHESTCINPYKSAKYKIVLPHFLQHKSHFKCRVANHTPQSFPTFCPTPRSHSSYRVSRCDRKHDIPDIDYSPFRWNSEVASWTGFRNDYFNCEMFACRARYLIVPLKLNGTTWKFLFKVKFVARGWRKYVFRLE
jgi:hypothetical protein